MQEQGAEEEASTSAMRQGDSNRGGSPSAGGKITPRGRGSLTKKIGVRRLLQLCGLHLNGTEGRKRGDEWGRHRKKVDA